jgi:hypothetical protein
MSFVMQSVSVRCEVGTVLDSDAEIAVRYPVGAKAVSLLQSVQSKFGTNLPPPPTSLTHIWEASGL